MNKIDIFCIRSTRGYYGFGLTPEAAVMQIIRAGLNRKYIEECKMIRLPPHIVSYFVDEMGGVNWSFTLGTEKQFVDAESTTLHMTVDGDWVEQEQPAVEKRKDLTTFRFSVKLMGEVEVKASNEQEATDMLTDMTYEDMIANMEDCDFVEVEHKLQPKRNNR